jgi:O-antigen ligase
MIAKYLNWVLVAACAAFLMLGTYSSRLTKICVMIAVGAFVLLHLCEDKKLFFKNLFEKTRLNKAIYLFLFIAVLSTVFGVSPYESQQVLFNRYVIYFIMFFIGAYLGQNKMHSKILIFSLLAGAVIVSVGSVVDIVKEGHFVQLFTSFGMDVIYGTYFLYTLPFFIGLIVFYPSNRAKLFFVVWGLPVMAAFLLHYSRSIWIGLMVSLFITGFLFGSKYRWRFLGAILLVVLTILAVPYLRVRLFDKKTTNPIAWGDRIPMWEASIEMFKKNPLLGIGLGTTGDFMYKVETNHPFQEGYGMHSHSHNTYLEIFGEMGILGLLSFLWIFVLFFKAGYKSIKGNPDAYKISFMIMFLAVAISDITVSTMLVGITAPSVFWFLFGLGSRIYGESIT